MKEEGFENRFARHAEMADYVREWAKKYFDLFAKEQYASNTVTCVKNTRDIDVSELNKLLAERGFTISNGYGKLKQKTFRIAHMAELTMDDMKELISNINDILGL
jgi:aspartate aminotransferase-like enzyme